MEKISQYKYPQFWSNRTLASFCPSRDQRTGEKLLSDKSGRQNNGAFAGSNVPTWKRIDGKTALEFTYNSGGLGSIVNIPTLNLGSEFTISLWLKVRSIPEFVRIFASGSDITPCAYLINFSATSVIWSINGTSHTYTVPNITLSMQHHCLVYKSGVMKDLWVNGTRVGTAVQTATCAPSTFHIGDRPAGGRGFDGYQDDYFVFSQALTPAEIKILAMQRGIAHETNPSKATRFGSIVGAATRSRNYLVGAY